MKKKFTIVLVFLWVFFLRGNGQSVVCEGDVMLSSQADVNNFQCTEITGQLYISGTDITDLSPLRGLTKVGALLITDCNSLPTLDGLSGITSITSRTGTPYVVGIAGNALLENLDGLSGIANDTLYSISISNNPSLESINAFSSVETVFGLFSIANNASLKSMNGFKNISSLQEAGFSPYLLIDNNPLLTNLDGFSSLETIVGHGANLDISNNATLSDIGGLSSLTTISGGGRPTGLFIRNNDALKNVDGLSSLSRLDYAVAGAVTITDNALLQNVDGLAGITLPSRNFYLTVTGNPALTNCDALYAILLSVGVENAASYSQIHGNGASCTLADIIANGPPSVIGYTMHDRRTGEQIRDFGAGDLYVDAAPPEYRHMVMHASTNKDKVGCVVFTVGEVTRIDNQAPFQFDFQFLAPGIHTIVTEVYSLPNRKGVKGLTRSIPFYIVNNAAVQSFYVVDEVGNVLKYLQDGDEINMKDPVYKSSSIVASVYPEQVGHVTFWLNNRRYRTEYHAPYALRGDNEGRIIAWRPRPGAYTLRAVPYAQTARKSYAGQPLEVNFTVVEQPLQIVTRLMIADARGNAIRPLLDGDKINLADTALKNFKIIAITDGVIGSVKFRRNGRSLSTTNDNPYSVSSDLLGNTLGYHLLSATPYPERDAAGEPGQAMRVLFRLVNGTPPTPAFTQQIGNMSLSLYPVPVRDQLNVEISGGGVQLLRFTLRNYLGHTVFEGTHEGEDATYQISMSDMRSGFYYLEVQGHGYKKVIRFVK
jgi:hypothetical protein